MAIGRSVDRLTDMRKHASPLAVVLVAISCACRDFMEIATSRTGKSDEGLVYLSSEQLFCRSAFPGCFGLSSELRASFTQAVSA